MRCAKQGLAERLELAGVLLDLGPEQIGEQVAAHISDELPVLTDLYTAALGVAIEIGLNPEDRVEVVDETAAATEDVKTGDGRLVGVNVNERKADRYFELGIVLRE